MKIIVFKKENGVFKGNFKNIEIIIEKLGRKRFQVSIKNMNDNRTILTYCEKSKKPNLKYLEEYFKYNFKTLGVNS
jgi:hypothetical protein